MNYFRGEIKKLFRSLLVQMKIAKSPFEINWPLTRGKIMTSPYLHRLVPQIFLTFWRPCSKDHATFYALDFVFWYSSYDVLGPYYDVILYCVKSSMKTHIRMCTSNWPVFIFANFYPVFQCIFFGCGQFYWQVLIIEK